MSDINNKDNQGEKKYDDLLFDWKAPKVPSRPASRRRTEQPKREALPAQDRVQPSSRTGVSAEPAASSEELSDGEKPLKKRSSKMQSLTQEELRILLSGGSLEKDPVRTEDMHLFSDAGKAAARPVRPSERRAERTARVHPEAEADIQVQSRPVPEIRSEPVSELRRQTKAKPGSEAGRQVKVEPVPASRRWVKPEPAAEAPAEEKTPAAGADTEDLLGLGSDETAKNKRGFGLHKSPVRKPQLRKPQIRPSAAIAEPKKEESPAKDAVASVSGKIEESAEKKTGLFSDREAALALKASAKPQPSAEPENESAAGQEADPAARPAEKTAAKALVKPAKKTAVRPAKKAHSFARNKDREDADLDYDDREDDEDADFNKGREGLPILKIGVILVAMAIVLLAIVFAALKFRDVKPVENQKQETVQELKYDQMSDFVTEDYLTVNTYSRPGIHTDPYTGIVLHYTEKPGASAKEVRDYFESLSVSHETRASANYVIDEDGSVIACVPLGEVAYASNSRNLDTISIEYCYSDESGKMSDAAYKSLIALCRLLCQEYSLSSSDVIRHYDITGKSCPKYYVDNPEAWTGFRADLADALKQTNLE